MAEKTVVTVTAKNVSDGPRGINVVGGATVYVEAGDSVTVDVYPHERDAAEQSGWFVFDKAVELAPVKSASVPREQAKPAKDEPKGR